MGSVTWRWPNFTPQEISCPHCNEMPADLSAMDNLQKMRNILKIPLHINSAHRCKDHNASVGGKQTSEHLGLAFDIALAGDPRAFHDAAIVSGFTGIGYGENYLHLDTRIFPARWHYAEGLPALWALRLFGGAP